MVLAECERMLDVVRNTQVDVVSGVYQDSSHITVITPPRNSAQVVHVSVANNGVAYSSAVLQFEQHGTALRFAYSAQPPQGIWQLDNATGPAAGGTQASQGPQAPFSTDPILRLRRPSIAATQRAPGHFFLSRTGDRSRICFTA